MMLRRDPYYDGIHMAFGYLGGECSDDLHLCKSKLPLGPPKYSKCAIECSGLYGYVGVDILVGDGNRTR